MEQVRLTPAKQFLAKYPHELSGGQRQRVSFARALAARPSVLLADEPVSMLDVSIRLEMLSLLDDLRQRFRLAMLYITHDIASARYFADEVLVMYAGEIVERGPAEEVTQQPGASLHPAARRLGPRPGQPRQHPARQRSAERCPGRRQQRRGAAAEPGRRGDGWLPVQPQVPVRRRPLPAEDPALMQISATRGAACWHLDIAAPELVSGRHREDTRPTQPTTDDQHERKTRVMRRLHSHRRLLAVAPPACSRSGSPRALERQLELGASSGSSSAATTGKTLVMESSPETTITQDVQPVRPHPGRLRHGRDRAHLRAADPVRPGRAADSTTRGSPRPTRGPTAARRSPSRSARA